MAEILRSPVEVGSLSHYLQGLVNPRWWSPDFWTINSTIHTIHVCYIYSNYNLVDFYGKLVGKYTSPMNAIGKAHVLNTLDGT